MQLFYSTEISNNHIILNEEESRHCVKVLRMRNGDRLSVTDGMGNLYQCRITEANPKQCLLEIVETRSEVGKRPYYLHIAIAPTKNIDRLEWFVEKAVEAGVDKITPLICRRSERTNLRLDRLQNLAISAMKQSLKTYRTEITDPAPFQSFVNEPFAGEKFICHCMDGEKIKPNGTFKPAVSLILIGPEGDFTEDEVRLAASLGYSALSLGNSRLRTETAGLAACMAVYLGHA